MIRQATRKDIEQITHIAQENKLTPTKKQDSFLVSNYQADDYRHFIDTLKHFYVLEEANKIEGFLFAYDETHLDMSLRVNQSIVHAAKHTFLILKQVAVAKAHHRKGVATSLYRHLMVHTDRDIYLAVVLEPLNEPSMAFHKQLQFIPLFEVREQDGIKRAILYFDNPKTSPYFNQTVLIENYETAKDLYMHEDALTWSKVNHLFYVSASLGAALVIATSINNENALAIGMILTGIIGVLASLLFNVAIKSGIFYMNARKEALMRIESQLKRHGGTDVLSLSVNKHKNRLRRSYTEYVLKALPLVLIIIWLSIITIGLISL